MKNKFLMIYIITLFAAPQSFSQHIGCVTVLSNSLCETETQYKLTSDVTNWTIDKDVFQTKIISILEKSIKLEGSTEFYVYLWSNDMDTMHAIKIQVWNKLGSFLVALPFDTALWDQDNLVTIRGMNDLPYPLDYGYTLGELILTCNESCSQESITYLKEFNERQKIDPLGSNILLFKCNKYEEIKILNQLLTTSQFQLYFSSIELSPALEANGFSDLSFKFSNSF